METKRQEQGSLLFVALIIVGLLIAYQFMGPHVDADKHLATIQETIHNGTPTLLFYLTPT